MTGNTSNFRVEAEKLRVAPPPSAWKRVEAQLDAEGARKQMRFAHLLNYAAAVVVTLCVAAAGLYMYSSQGISSNDHYSLTLESLSPTYAEGTSIYDVDKVKSLTALWTQ